MKIKVEHLDDKGRFEDLEFDLTYLQFTKHLAFAGMGVHRSLYNLFRFTGYMLEFVQYWRIREDRFAVPEVILHDPTELGQLSNRIGKGLADFLAKRIYGAKYTHNYESAMVQYGHPIKGRRPDLYCDTGSRQFAVEAKGYKVSSVSENKMLEHKSQSLEGPVPVHFSVASVAFDLYESPTIKFHDPVGEGIEYAEGINKKLISIYYRSIMYSIEQVGMERSDRVENLPEGYIAYEIPFLPPRRCLYLLLHKSIVENMWDDIREFPSDYAEDDIFTYIDVDGVGLCIR
ncbi:hypothetical protein V6R97_07310 [Chromohalobacter salexigens]|uniref:hypothetical protein n=1 Tax=Chromohalobacter israelensis TaxID=141390 RepID=UPI0032E87DAF